MPIDPSLPPILPSSKSIRFLSKKKQQFSKIESYYTQLRQYPTSLYLIINYFALISQFDILNKLVVFSTFDEGFDPGSRFDGSQPPSIVPDSPRKDFPETWIWSDIQAG